MTTEKTFDIDGLQPNSQYTLRVRALYRNGSYSEWSKSFKLKVKGDDSPPSQPSAPTIFVPDLTTELSRNSSAMGPQTIRFRHDSTKNGGGPLEGDIDYFEVYVNTTNSNSGGTQIGTVKATRPGSGAFAEANLPVNAPGESTNRWFYVIGVDMSGLRSPASPTTQASSIPMIANAYISDLSADKITTGTLQASQKITVGDSVAIALKSNNATPKAEFFSYSGSEPSIGAGFNNNSVGFYMDSTGRFSLKQALIFDPEANDGAGKLTINADGAFSGSLTSEISLAAPIITGGSINIGPDIFQVNSSGRVIATNIESAIIKGGQIWIGGTNPSNSNFYVDSSGNLVTRGSATIAGPVISGGSITGGSITGGSITGGSITGGSITGGSINIGPDVFQVNSSGRVIATNIETAQIYGGQIWIGGTTGSPNFQVDASGNLTTRGSATIAGPVISGGSITASLFKTSAVTGINRIEIDGTSQKDNIRFLNMNDGNFEIRIAGPNLNIDNNYTGTLGPGWTGPPDVRIRSTTSIRPNSNSGISLEVYRPTTNSTQRIVAITSDIFSSIPPPIDARYIRTEILSSGTINNATGGYGTFSDERMKENIRSARNYLSDLMNIEVIKYNLINNEEDLLGFSAQQVRPIFPHLISEDEDGYLSIKTSIFIPMLITAVKELNNRVQYLEAKLEELNG